MSMCSETYMNKYLFWFIFDVTLTIMFVLAHDFIDTPYKSIKEFRVKLAKDLLETKMTTIKNIECTFLPQSFPC